MVIEWLRFTVKPESREKFIKEDAEIWTEFLARQGGYLGKEIWINPAIENEVISVVHWQTREQWHSIEKALLDETEAKFKAAMGEGTYKLVEVKEYQVRKFADRSSAK